MQKIKQNLIVKVHRDYSIDCATIATVSRHY